MTRRDAQRQGEPADIDDSFPAFAPGRGTWFRAHTWRGADGGCWYYACLPAPEGRIGGRFDLPSPRGTCYFASTELAAARERLGRSGGLIAHDEVEGARVSTVQFDPGPLADLLDPDAARRGVTQELASSVPYGLAQRWAAAFDATGFVGVRYQPRFSTDRVEAVACFGDAGRPTPAEPVTSSRPVVDVLREHDYLIIESPSLTTLSPLIN